MKELLELFLTFAKIGVMTFGGGMAMLPILEREVVQNKHWATEEELVDYFAQHGQQDDEHLLLARRQFVRQ